MQIWLFSAAACDSMSCTHKPKTKNTKSRSLYFSRLKHCRSCKKSQRRIARARSVKSQRNVVRYRCPRDAPRELREIKKRKGHSVVLESSAFVLLVVFCGFFEGFTCLFECFFGCFFYALKKPAKSRKKSQEIARNGCVGVLTSLILSQGSSVTASPQHDSKTSNPPRPQSTSSAPVYHFRVDAQRMVIVP